MLFRIIGRLLFPRAQPWERKRKVKTMFAVLMVSLIFASCIGAVIYRHNFSR